MKSIEEIIALLKLDGMVHSTNTNFRHGEIKLVTIFNFEDVRRGIRAAQRVYKVNGYGVTEEQALRDAFEKHNELFPKWKDENARR